MHGSLEDWAEARGYEVAWGPADVAVTAARTLRRRHDRGELDEAVFSAEYEAISAEPDIPSWATVLVVAVPRPAHRVGFDRGDGAAPLPGIFPPTYVRYGPVFEEIRRDLAVNGLPGRRVEHLGGPTKSIAAALGLVRYGRNNITYAGRAGSYVQLCGFITDASLPPRDLPDGPQALDACADCDRCRRACPTGAIGTDRFLLHVERCLTLANESAEPWPSWASGTRMRSVVGCLDCQRACPANPPLVVEETGLVFSVEETQALLAHPDGPPTDATSGVWAKLAWLGQAGLRPILGRNLAALAAGRVPTAGDDGAVGPPR